MLQFGRLAGLELHAIASQRKLPILTEYGATPTDYHTQDSVAVIREVAPGGLDIVLDGMKRQAAIRGALSLVQRGGRMVRILGRRCAPK